MCFRMVVCVAAVAVAASGCANFNTQSRGFTAHQASAQTVDASQRAIYAVNKTYIQDGKATKQWTAFCAEPSPDALFAFATSLAASANTPGKALDLAVSQQQSAASMGLRTQTIQLLRDGMYRLCESYASGAIDNDDMAMLQRRYQNMMLGLLAIEQITGPVIARQVSLGSTASAAIGKSVAEVTKVLGDAAGDLAKAKSDVADADADVKSKQAKLDQANQNKKDSPGDDADAAQATASADLAASLKVQKKAAIDNNAKQAAYNSIESVLKDTQKMTTAASSSVIFADPNPTNPANESDFKVAVNGVTTIVTSILESTQQSDLCTSIFLFSPLSKAKAQAFERSVEYCAFLAVPVTSESDTQQLSARNELRQRFIVEMRKNIAERSKD